VQCLLAVTQSSIDETLKLIIVSLMRGSAVFGVRSNMPFCLIILIEYGVRVSGQGEKLYNSAARALVV